MNRIVLGVMLGLVALVATACSSSTATPVATIPSEPDPRPSAGGTEHWLGAPNAPTIVEEYSDLQWPGCRDFALGQGRQLEQTFVAEGQVRFVYRHFVVLAQESVWAAEASECAADQNHFWAYRDQLFQQQVPQHNVGNFSKPRLEGIAASLGLDGSQFNRCLDSERYGLFVQQASAAAQQRGVSHTPTIFLAGHQVKTPASFDELTSLLLEPR